MIDLDDAFTETCQQPTQPGPIARHPLDRPRPPSLRPRRDELDEFLVALVVVATVVERIFAPDGATSAAVCECLCVSTPTTTSTSSANVLIAVSFVSRVVPNRR